jgi:ketosteroid isomerase-like protein
VSVDVVRRFIDAFNAEDLDVLVAVLDPEAEIQTSRGIVIGYDEARRWATRNPTGELHQRLVLDDVRDAGPHVIAAARRQWYWRDPEYRRDHGEIADETELTIVATIRDGLIARWQPFEDPEEALRAAGL